MKKRSIWIILVIGITLIAVPSILRLNEDNGVEKTLNPPEETPEPPAEIPKGILVNEIPEDADILFVSMRYVLNDLACLDENYEIKTNFLSDSECIKKIYDAESDVLASPRQLYAYDIETGNVTQLTNVGYDFSSSKPVDSYRIMAIGAGDDTDGDGIISTKDEINIYLIDLAEEEIECLTQGLNLTSINNPDYSKVNEKILFSAQRKGVFHNYLLRARNSLSLECRFS